MRAWRPIANKYRKGKLKSTSFEELKEHEIRLMRTVNLGSSKGAGSGSSWPYGAEYGTAVVEASLGKAVNGRLGLRARASRPSDP